jgi:hypothetical protein
MLNAGLMGFLQLTVRSATGRGSYALATTMEQIFNRSRIFVAQDMARQITNEVIGPLIAYNYGVDAPVPRFQFGPLNNENDQAALSAFQQIMAAQDAHVPTEFYDELITRVASILNLDPGKVAKDIEVHGSPADSDLEILGTKVEAAHAAVVAAKQNNENMKAMGPMGKAPSVGGAPVAGAKSGGQGATPTAGRPAAPSTVGTRPFGANSVTNPGREKNKNYGK